MVNIEEEDEACTGPHPWALPLSQCHDDGLAGWGVMPPHMDDDPYGSGVFAEEFDQVEEEASIDGGPWSESESDLPPFLWEATDENVRDEDEAKQHAGLWHRIQAAPRKEGHGGDEDLVPGET